MAEVITQIGTIIIWAVIMGAGLIFAYWMGKKLTDAKATAKGKKLIGLGIGVAVFAFGLSMAFVPATDVIGVRNIEWDNFFGGNGGGGEDPGAIYYTGSISGTFYVSNGVTTERENTSYIDNIVVMSETEIKAAGGAISNGKVTGVDLFGPEIIAAKHIDEWDATAEEYTVTDTVGGENYVIFYIDDQNLESGDFYNAYLIAVQQKEKDDENLDFVQRFEPRKLTISPVGEPSYANAHADYTDFNGTPKKVTITGDVRLSADHTQLCAGEPYGECRLYAYFDGTNSTGEALTNSNFDWTGWKYDKDASDSTDKHYYKVITTPLVRDDSRNKNGKFPYEIAFTADSASDINASAVIVIQTYLELRNPEGDDMFGGATAYEGNITLTDA